MVCEVLPMTRIGTTLCEAVAGHSDHDDFNSHFS